MHRSFVCYTILLDNNINSLQKYMMMWISCTEPDIGFDQPQAKEETEKWARH